MMETGYTVNGRYQVIRPLGEGGMANVYLAKDLILDREVAVKVLRLDLRSDPTTVKRFQREALATTELMHPNIVSIYDVGEENGVQYIVMEYVKGTDLKKYIVEHFPIPYQRVIDIMTQILSAVRHAHEHDIIHRDLKPQNILVDEQGNVKITDFGIAIALSDNSITQTNSLLGSVHYLSPEQARGGMATKRSDIYSLGIILYELLTGSVPFEGESAVSIAIKHFQNDIPSVRAFDPRIPQALENVVLRATAKDPVERYATAQEMSDDLNTSLSADRAKEAPFEPTHRDETEKTRVIPDIKQAMAADAAATREVQAVKADDTRQVDGKKKKPTNKKRRKWLIGIGSVVAALLLIVILAVALNKKDVLVPDLTDMTQQQAQTALTQAKLNLGEVHNESSANVSKNRIIRSTPAKDTSVKEGSSVDVYISTGAAKFTLDDYTDEVYTDVSKALEKKGFTVKKIEKQSNTVASGLIMKQDLAEGKKVSPKKTTITFTVSTGKKSFALRDLSNYTEKSVTDYADENGLKLTISRDYSDSIASGMVISQSPSAGTATLRGDTLSVVISKGKEEKAPETTTFNKQITVPYAASDSSDESSITGSSATTQNIIQIYIGDSTHQITTLYRQLTITKDTSVDLPFTIETGKSGSYRIVRDGEQIMADSNVTQ